MSERIVGVLLFALAVGYGWLARGYRSDFASDPLGPSSFPLLLAALLALSSIYLIVRPGPEPDWPQGRTLVHQIAAVIVLCAYAFALEPIGFLPGTFAAITVIAMQLGAGYRAALALGIGGSLVLYGVFDLALGLSLPMGTLFGD